MKQLLVKAHWRCKNQTYLWPSAFCLTYLTVRSCAFDVVSELRETNSRGDDTRTLSLCRGGRGWEGRADWSEYEAEQMKGREKLKRQIEVGRGGMRQMNGGVRELMSRIDAADGKWEKALININKNASETNTSRYHTCTQSLSVRKVMVWKERAGWIKGNKISAVS